MTGQEIAELVSAAAERIQAADRTLLGDMTPQRYIAELDAVDEFANYSLTTPALNGLSNEIARRAGQTGLEEYHRLILLRLIQDFPTRAARRQYPVTVTERFEAHFDKIVAGLGRPKTGFYLLKNDSFLKDLAVCRQHLIPCGIQFVERASGIPRSSILLGGMRQRLRFASTMAKLGGFRPLLQPHTDHRYLREFNAAGWLRFYGFAAELLRWNKGIRGLFASSWWWDPAVGAISPHLSYLRATPEAAGAHFFNIGESEQNTANAVANSPERYRLWKEGQFRPQCFMIVWLREDLLKMAEQAESS